MTARSPFDDTPELPDADADLYAATMAEGCPADFPPAKEVKTARRKQSRPAPKAKQTAEPMQFISLIDAASLPYMQYVVKGWIPLFGVGQIYGEPACYKSFTVLSLCIHISEGWDFCGCRVKRRPVYYLQLEGAGGLSKRVQAFLEWMRKTGKPPLSGVFRFWTDNFQILEEAERNSLIAGIKADCEATGMEGAVIVIDTQSQASIGADENTDDMAKVLRHARDIAKAVNGVCLMVHHTGKDKARGQRGHSSQLGNVDFTILAEKKGKGSALWTSTKEKEDDDGQTIGFKIHVLQVGIDDDGDPVTSCVAEPCKPEKAKGSAVAEVIKPNSEADRGLKAFLLALHDAKTDGIHIEDWRKVYYAKSTADSPNTKRNGFTRARNALVGMGVLSVDNDIYALTPDFRRRLQADTATPTPTQVPTQATHP